VFVTNFLLYYFMDEIDTFNTFITDHTVGRDSSVGISTAYGLEGPGIESRLGRDFPHLSRPVLRPIQSPVQWVPGLSWDKLRARRDADPSPLLVPRSKIE